MATLPSFFRQQNTYGGDNANAMAGMSPGYSNPNQPPNIFAGTQDTTQSPDTIPPESIIAPPEDTGPQGDLNVPSVVTDTSRQTVDTDALRKLSGQFPNPQDYKPNLLRKIGSALVGISEGSEAQSRFNEEPYNQALSTWKARIAPAENLANIERYGNTNVDRAMYNNARIGIMQQGENRKLDYGQEKLSQGWTNLDQHQQTINENQKKIEHLISRTDLTDTEKLALMNRYKLEQEAAKGEIEKTLQTQKDTAAIARTTTKGQVDKDVQELRNKGALATQGLRNTGAIATRATVPGGAGATSMLPSQQTKGLQNRYGQALREHPEWEPYLKIDANGQVRISPVGTSVFGHTVGGPDQKTQDAIKAYIEQGQKVVDLGTAPKGAGTPVNTSEAPSGAGEPNKPASTSATPSGAGTLNKEVVTPSQGRKVRVKAPDGRTGTWDLSKGEIPKGFVEIK